MRPLIITHVGNEPLFLPVWLAYHRQHADTLVLFEDDAGVSFHLKRTYADTMFMQWRLDHSETDTSVFELSVVNNVETIIGTMLRLGHPVVAHLDCDEFLLPAGGEPLSQWLEGFLSDTSRDLATPQGWNVYQHPWWELSVSAHPDDILADRQHCTPSIPYSKPVVTKVPQTWAKGFHRRCVSAADRSQKITDIVDPTLDLVHLKHVDLDELCRRYSTGNYTYSQQQREVWSRELEKWSRASTDRVKDAWRNRLVQTHHAMMM